MKTNVTPQDIRTNQPHDGLKTTVQVGFTLNRRGHSSITAHTFKRRDVIPENIFLSISVFLCRVQLSLDKRGRARGDCLPLNQSQKALFSQTDKDIKIMLYHYYYYCVILGRFKISLSYSLTSCFCR